jgi:hypothetical protein
MCIGRDLLANGGWQALSLTEDLELYARWTAAGLAIDYAGDARLLSQEVRTLDQADAQRRRWASGRLEVLRHWLPAALASRRIGALQKADLLVELGAPSPAVHLLIAVAVAVAAWLVYPPGVRGWMAGLALWSVSGRVGAVLLALARHPEPGATLAALARLPGYAVWRGWLALRSALTSRPDAWRKTTRNPAEP